MVAETVETLCGVALLDRALIGAPVAVRVEAETLKRRGLNAYQGVLQAIWSDERIASACVAMTSGS